MSNKDEKLLIFYNSKIDEFENSYIKDNFINYKSYGQHRGYLIKLENYYAIRNKIKQYFQEWKSASKILASLSSLEEIEFKTSSYLINMLLNGNKYIIINNEIWTLFGKKEKKDNALILYSININYIIFSLDDKKVLVFGCKSQNNIIDKSSFSKENNNFYPNFLENYEIIKKSYQEISDYYDFEKELESYLKYYQNNKNFKDYAYFVDINWLKKWKEIRNYENIKELIKAKKEKTKIMNLIILLEEINRKRQLNISKIILKNFESIEQLKEFLLKNSLALVSSFFVHNFEKNPDGYFQYCPSKNKIKISISFKELNIQTMNNINKLVLKNMV